MVKDKKMKKNSTKLEIIIFNMKNKKDVDIYFDDVK